MRSGQIARGGWRAAERRELRPWTLPSSERGIAGNLRTGKVLAAVLHLGHTQA